MANNNVTVALGRVPKERGVYSSSNHYYKDNIVEYQGSAYIAAPTSSVNDGNDGTQDSPEYYLTRAPFASDPSTPNSGWRVFANGRHTFSTGEEIGNVGIDSVPVAGSTKLVESGGVEKYIAKDKEIVNNPTINDGYIKADGSVSSNTEYGYVTGILLGPRETILVNNGNPSYRPAGAPAVFETDAQGTFVRSLVLISPNKSTVVKYTNTKDTDIYVGFSAYNKNGLLECKYTIYSLVEAAGRDSTELAISAERERALSVESKRLSVEEQSLTNAQKERALLNLGITGIDVNPSKGSTKIVSSGGVYNYVRGESRILTLVGKGDVYAEDSCIVEGFIPNHRYRFTILNFDEWGATASSNSTVIMRVLGYNNMQGVEDVANNKFVVQVSNAYYWNMYNTDPIGQYIQKEFDYIFPDHCTKTVEGEEVNVPVDKWYVKVNGRAGNGNVLKLLAEDITGLREAEQEITLNTSSEEWIPFNPDFIYRTTINTDTGKIDSQTKARARMYYYPAKAGDVIKFTLENNSYAYVSKGIYSCDNIPRIGLPATLLVATSSTNTVNSSVITVSKDCYVGVIYDAGCTIFVKNKGLSYRVGNTENAIDTINETLANLDTDVPDTSVSNYCAYLDKQLLLENNRGYYFDDAYGSEISFIDTSYMDRKFEEIPEGKHFIFFTDSHIDYSEGVGIRQNATPVIKYVRDRLGIKNVIFGGDVIGKRPTKYIAAKVMSIYTKELFEAFGSDFLFVMGNHDTNPFIPTGGTIEDALISDVEVYKRTTKFMKGYGEAVFPTKLIDIIDTSDDLRDDSGNLMSQDEKDNYIAWAMMNYYYDDNTQKIRYIVLETGDGGMTMRNIFGMTGDSQNSLLTVGYFFVEALKTMPEGYDVVVTGHWIIESGRFWKKVFYKTLALYKNKQSASVDFSPLSWGTEHTNVPLIIEKTFDNPSSLNITVDFTDSIGSGRVFCISGHEHYDRAVIKGHTSDDNISVAAFPVSTSTTPQSLEYTPSSILQIICDRCCGIGQGSSYIDGTVSNCYSYPNDFDSIPQISRTGTEVVRIGTIKEVLFDIVTLTPDNRVVLTRFGAEGEDNGLPYVRDYVLPMASE